MSPLLAKEVRLLLPAYGVALLLAIVPVWLLPNDPHNPAAFSLYSFWFGAVMLALSPFGREFGLHTIPLILAQPLERTRIWWTKVAVQAVAMTTVFAAWCLSCVACVYLGLERSDDWPETLMNGGIATIIFFVGGLWTTLLLRQVIAAFWFTILIPWTIAMVIGVNGGSYVLICVVLGFYAVVGFWWARRQFLSVQEVPWTGGVIPFPGWRTADAGVRSSIRIHRPVAALFWKELQLHQVLLAGMAGLFVLHLGVVALRRLGNVALGNTLHSALEVFGGIWLIVPLLAAGPSVAEERKLGTMDAHLCLPISRRAQYAIKLLFALVLGGLLSAVLLWTAEGIGSAVGASSGINPLKTPFDRQALVVLSLTFLALSLIGFYASTMARNVLQALATAVAAAFGVWFVMAIASHPPEVFRIWFWQGNLVYYVACPTLVATFVWLAWRNFRNVPESWRLWRRNVLGLTAALVFVAASTFAIYHRAWELITPLEPAHGPARLVGAKPTTLHIYGGGALATVLPDGGLWVDRIAYDPGSLCLAFGEDTGFRLSSHWISLSGNQIIPGSNWTDAVAKIRDTVAIRSDGTLWVSEKPGQGWDWGDGKPRVERAAGLVQFGNETNWLSVVPGAYSVVLLKRDGTLWRLGTNNFNMTKKWPGLRSFKPYRLGNESDWERILSGGGGLYAWKSDGRAWALQGPDRNRKDQEIELEPGELVMKRVPVFDNTKWRNLTRYVNFQVGVREDGTLWAWNTRPLTGGEEDFSPKAVQIGKATDWAAVASEFNILVGLKTDGSLWQWRCDERVGDYVKRHWIALINNPPSRLGRHSDWAAIGSSMNGTFSLAADGSLWHWWARTMPDNQLMLLPSRRPVKIENIFAGRE